MILGGDVGGSVLQSVNLFFEWIRLVSALTQHESLSIIIGVCQFISLVKCLILEKVKFSMM